MKLGVTAISVCAVLFAGTACAKTPEWLVGCWETPDKSAKEVWVAEPDGSMIGFDVVLNSGDIAFYEVLRIRLADNGALKYTAYPVAQSAATFTARSKTGTSVIFSNPSHDYPQEISYRLDGDVLYASIAGLNGENKQSFNKRRCR